MEKQEVLKESIRKEKIDRRELAEKIGVSPSYLGQMLNGWTPMKEKYETAIKKELDERR